MLQKNTDPDCNGDLDLTKFMHDLVFDSWHECKLTGFVFSIYKKGSNVPTAIFVYNCSCVCTITPTKSAKNADMFTEN